MAATPSRKMFAPVSPEAERVGKTILDAAFKVHTALGPGLLESVYETCTAFESRESGLQVATQVILPVAYRGLQMDAGLRIDMLAEKCVIVEFKSVDKMISLYDAQLLTYMRLTGIRLGFLLNFNVVHLKDGIKRIVL